MDISETSTLRFGYIITRTSAICMLDAGVPYANQRSR
jgi:hypothetical protein